jgi:23S rRNA pseudouridine1911/1915/1917 synthase
MIVRYNVEIQEEMMIKDYLEGKLPAALLTLISKQKIRFLVNNQAVYNYYKLKNNDLLEVIIPVDEENENIKPINKEFKILYEDSYLLIIDKEPNLACLPTKKHFNNSLANHVSGYYRRTGKACGIHFVNRLDFATAGIVVLAKDTYTTTLMKDAILEKKYLLEVEGIITVDGVIETGIKKDPDSAIKRMVTYDFINSKTIYKVLKNNDSTTLIEATLITGKTHQLRLHFSDLGYPIVGDKLYGKESENNLKLHSYIFSFIHPITKKEITITSYPKWYQDCL